VKSESQQKLFYFLGISFIILNAALIIKGHYWLVAVPLAVALLMVLFFSIDKLLLFIAFITPLSFNFKFAQMGFSVGIPNEPLLLAATFMFFLRVGLKPDYDTRILKHPISIIVIIQLLWMLITTATSEMPLVSVKYFLSHLWFVVPFYFLAIYLFRDIKNMRKFFWLFGISLVVVVFIAFIKNAGFGFERKAIATAVAPFFNDHTHYAATLALVAPVFLVMAFLGSSRLISKIASPIFFSVFLIGVFLSYSRAAWMSVLIAAIAFVVLAIKIRPRYIVVGLVLIGAVVLFNQEKIFMRLKTHTQDSSEDVAEHFVSAANITTDASNVERINRWVSAFRMFKERPVFGWGPGTYQFVYAPFQLSEYFNVVTTNVGDVGNAHSEYIGPLSESGLVGMVLMVLLVFFAFRTGIKIFRHSPSNDIKLMALGIIIGFVSYFSHGFLNNFLDTDKVAVPLWGMMAILVSLDLFSKDLLERNQS
jgi:putative inorganic carbon (HCO3(-)) transporter